METLVLDGKEFVKASKAADDLGYTADYVGQLCRAGKVSAHLVGRTWYVNVTELGTHRVEKKRMSRVKAREQAHKAVEEQRKLRVQNLSDSKSPSYIRYEDDAHELIPQVRKVEIVDENKSTKTVEPPHDDAPPFEIENEGNKIVMSGTLRVVDLNEEVLMDDGSVTLSPRIMRKNHKKQALPTPDRIKVQVVSEEDHEATISNLTEPEPVPVVAAPRSFSERLKLMDEESEKASESENLDTSKVSDIHEEESEENVSKSPIKNQEEDGVAKIRAEIRNHKGGGGGFYLIITLATLLLVLLSFGVSVRWEVSSSKSSTGGYSLSSTFVFEKGNILEVLKEPFKI